MYDAIIRSRYLKPLAAVITLVAMVASMTMLFFIVQREVRTMHVKYRISKMVMEKQKLLRERERLMAKRASTYDLAEIKKIAEQQLGLTEPSTRQVIIVPMPRLLLDDNLMQSK